MKKVSLGLSIAWVLVLLLVLAGAITPLGAQTAPVDPSRELQGTSDADSYLIGKGDILEINVWREPMLSGETIVRNDGKISFTLLGDVQAAGRTTSDLKDEIQERLKSFLGEPVVTVMLRTPASQKFYVIGEVRTPGEYDLVKDMTVVQGIARAGGFTEWADKGKIVLLRKERGEEKKIRVNYKDIIKGNNIGQNILLRANDTIVVP
jgi:polysaccharide export outer membrane protein